MTTAIKTRRPTGAVPWPLILIEGGEKTGKSWAAAEFTADERLGQTYWIDLAEGSADEYAAIAGADYLVVDHDGTWADILGQVSAIRDEATRANQAGEKPVVLVIDSMTAEWEMLKDWVGERALTSNYAKKILARDPSAEIKPANNLWNDANQRHGKLMRLLMTFPGIVLITARGKEVAEIGSDGKPVPNSKVYKVEGQKTLGFDVSAWVRLSRDEAPRVVGVRSVHAGVRPGVDKPVPAPQFTVSWLVFDVLKCDPKTAKVRELQALDSTPDEPIEAETVPDRPQQNRPPAKSSADMARQALGMAPPERDAVDAKAAEIRKSIEQAATKDELKALWMAAGELTPDYTGDLRARAEAKVADLDALAAAAAETLQTELGAQPIPEQSAA